MFQRRLHILNMRKIHNKERNIQVTFTYEEGFEKILIPQTLLANCGSYITHTLKYSQERFNFKEAPPKIEEDNWFKELSQSKVRKCKADD